MIDINKVEPNREQPRKKFDEDALIAVSYTHLGGKLNKIEQFGYSDNHRSFVIIDKVMNTSNKYPRKAGLLSLIHI